MQANTHCHPLINTAQNVHVSHTTTTSLYTQDSLLELGLLDIWEGLEDLVAVTEGARVEDPLGAT